MLTAQSLVKHIAHLQWVDADGRGHGERHAAWSARQATTMAYRRARSMMTSGQAQAYRIEHHERVMAQGEVIPANDPFGVPAMPAGAAA